MYHRHSESGASSAYWEAFGSESSLADHLRFCAVDPLRPLFERFVVPGATVLEGGCGRGQYVAYYTARGSRVVGLDFARAWLAAIHAEVPSLLLCAGDVGALPFGSGVFDVYYSGGVVEHFEAGANRALAEARRVIKDDGVLLISVPYLSPLRRLLAAFGRPDWRRVAAPGVDAAAPSSLRFYQYAYTIEEFTRLLTSAGFRVTGTQGYAVVWGLYEIGALKKLGSAVQRPRAASPAPSVGPAGLSAALAAGAARRPSLLKRLIVGEDASVPIAGLAVRAARVLCANMMMYVCVPAGSTSS